MAGPEQQSEDGSFDAGLQDPQQNDGPEDHEQEDGVEEQDLQVVLAIDDRIGDPVVADDPIVDQHHRHQQHLSGDSECGNMDDPNLHNIECPLHWLDCLAQGVCVYAVQVGPHQHQDEGQYCQGQHHQIYEWLADGAEAQFGADGAVYSHFKQHV